MDYDKKNKPHLVTFHLDQPTLVYTGVALKDSGCGKIMNIISKVVSL